MTDTSIGLLALLLVGLGGLPPADQPFCMTLGTRNRIVARHAGQGIVYLDVIRNFAGTGRSQPWQ